VLLRLPVFPQLDPVDKNALRATLEGYISPKKHLIQVLEFYTFL